MKSLKLIVLAVSSLFIACDSDIINQPNDFDNRYDISTIEPDFTDVFDTSIRLSGRIGGNEEFEKVGFFLSETKNVTSDNSTRIEATLAVTIFTANATGLQPKESYYVAAFGENGANITLGNEIKITTLDEIKDVVFKSTVVEPINSRNCKVYIQIDEQEGAQPSMVKEYGIKYWLDSAPESEAVEITIDSNADDFLYIANKGFYIDVNDLVSNKVYKCRFYARTKETGVYIPDSEFEIDLPDVNAPKISDAEILLVTGRQIELQGSILETGDDIDLAYGFTLLDGSGGVVADVPMNNGDASNGLTYTYTFFELELSTSYTVRHYAISQSLKEEFPDDPDLYQMVLEKTVSTTADDRVIVNLSDLTATSYPQNCDVWIVNTPGITEIGYLHPLTDILDNNNGGRILDISLPDIKTVKEHSMFAASRQGKTQFKLRLPNVTHIDSWAFVSSHDMLEATISPYTNLGQVFNDCVNLTKVDVSDKNDFVGPVPDVNGITLGEYIFNGCTSLKSVELGYGTLMSGSFYGNDNAIEILKMPYAPTVPAWMLANQKQLKEVTLAPYTSVEMGAFANANVLEKVSTRPLEAGETPPTSVTIGENAFLDCVSLILVDMPYVTEVHPTAFNGCTSLDDNNKPNP